MIKILALLACLFAPDIQPTVTSYCEGHPYSLCPCGNWDPYAGCANATGVGARLFGDGRPGDDLFFQAFNLTGPALLFMGEQAIQAPFGDGMRCTGQNVIRIGWKPGTYGVAIWMTQQLPQSLPVGTFRYFQALYLDTLPQAPCGTGWNLTNGARLYVMI